MNVFVLDTSVAIAWYLPESFSPSARKWQRELIDNRLSLVTPSLHYWEFANVLVKYVRRGELSNQLALEIHGLHLQAPIQTAEPDAGKVLESALRYEATAYDAVYIALSLDLDLPLLTAEKATTPWVASLLDRVVHVR